MNVEENCLFCLIAKKKVNSKILAEDENSIAFLDVNPISNGHALIITKKHYDNLLDIDSDSWSNLFSVFKEVSEKIKKEYNPKGFNFISNIGEEAYQSINHLHIHLIPKYKKEEGFIWSSNN